MLSCCSPDDNEDGSGPDDLVALPSSPVLAASIWARDDGGAGDSDGEDDRGGGVVGEEDVGGGGGNVEDGGGDVEDREGGGGGGDREDRGDGGGGGSDILKSYPLNNFVNLNTMETFSHELSINYQTDILVLLDKIFK